MIGTVLLIFLCLAVLVAIHESQLRGRWEAYAHTLERQLWTRKAIDEGKTFSEIARSVQEESKDGPVC